MTTLAIDGGEPVGQFTIPPWPLAAPRALTNVQQVLESRRWSVAGVRGSGPSAEERFAGRYAEFIGVPYCVPTNNGTSALVVAMQALGVGTGDEVIVPALTWVANATSVLVVNATPTMVDIDPATLCASPATIEAAITERTRAIVLVHLFSSVADLDAILAIGDRHGIPVIEDCSHAHGASWRGRRVGTWGAAGAFSMQEKKLLASGEGGAVVCRDAELYDRLYQLRFDGRRAREQRVEGEYDFTLDTTVTGSNYCMSEVCAAVLDAQLDSVPAQNAHRRENAAVVDKLLAEVAGVTPVAALAGVTERTFYYYAARIEPEAFGGATAATVCRALAAETGLPFQPTYPPLYRHPLFKPGTNRSFLPGWPGPEQVLPSPDRCPETERAHREILTFHHPALLASATDFELLPAAIEKVQRHAARLRALDEDQGAGG
jgi:L-glutamine:2-deoxy-scyllo-inosose/3-amino-2,3-dideoxy-scyllo-inosose aminotransferase